MYYRGIKFHITRFVGGLRAHVADREDEVVRTAGGVELNDYMSEAKLSLDRQLEHYTTSCGAARRIPEYAVGSTLLSGVAWILVCIFAAFRWPALLPGRELGLPDPPLDHAALSVDQFQFGQTCRRRKRMEPPEVRRRPSASCRGCSRVKRATWPAPRQRRSPPDPIARPSPFTKLSVWTFQPCGAAIDALVTVNGDD